MAKHWVVLRKTDRTVLPKILAIRKLMCNPNEDISVDGGQGL